MSYSGKHAKIVVANKAQLFYLQFGLMGKSTVDSAVVLAFDCCDDVLVWYGVDSVSFDTVVTAIWLVKYPVLIGCRR